MPSSTVTPKGTLTLSKIGSGFNTNSVSTGLTSTFKFKKDALSGSVAFSDKTVLPAKVDELKKFKDVVLIADYKLPEGGVTLNTKYELGPKKYQVGATWDGKLAKKSSTIKAWHTNKDNLFAGEATVTLDRANKANVTFNQKQLLTAKYTFVKGDFTLEPSYNFVKSAPAVAVTKKLNKDTLKLSYDIKSEGAALEYNRKPVKVTLSTSVGRSLTVAKPTLAVVFENTYDL